jgi:hypothetical protein
MFLLEVFILKDIGVVLNLQESSANKFLAEVHVTRKRLFFPIYYRLMNY